MKVLRIRHEVRNKLMQMLYKMNIGQASLFPGLDGFARSLKDPLVFPRFLKMFPPDSSYVRSNVR